MQSVLFLNIDGLAIEIAKSTSEFCKADDNNK